MMERGVFPQQIGKLFRQNGPAEVVPLHLITGVFLQDIHLFFRFNTFGYNGKTLGFGHGNDRLGNRHIVTVL